MVSPNKPPPGAPHSTALLAVIAAHLEAFAVDAESFGVVLCSDANVATRYLVQLQQVDRLSQSLREMARVLASGDPDTTVSTICLGDLRGALEQAEAGWSGRVTAPA
jgi:hypothetical protein